MCIRWLGALSSVLYSCVKSRSCSLMLAVWPYGVGGGMVIVGQNSGLRGERRGEKRACGADPSRCRAPRAHLRHVANVPTHVLDALHAVPQVAHEAVTVPYEREDRDHRRHRVRLIRRVKAGQPAAWRGLEWAGVSPHEPHSRDKAGAHCCRSSLSSHSAAIISLTLRTPSACQRTNMAEPVWRSGRAPSCGEASAPRTVAR